MTSAALASRFRSSHAGENCTDLNQVVARAEQSVSAIAGHSLGVQFALSPNVTLVAVPVAYLEQILLGLCTAARAVLSPGGRIVVETRGMNDAPVGSSSGVMQASEARARVVVRAEQLGQEPATTPQRRVNALTQAELGCSAIEQLLERLGGRLEFVPLSDGDLAYVAHLPRR
jgi:hypothetical protein